MNMTRLECPEGIVNIEADGDVNHIKVEPFSKDTYMGSSSCSTKYPLDLIKRIVDVLGMAKLCDDILRDEQYSYVQKPLELAMFSYLAPDDFEGKRLLDFGCGGGNATVVLARMLPKTDIIGVELVQSWVDLANERKQIYGQDHLTFVHSPDSADIPSHVGKFDYIVLNAVYEHLLPAERHSLLPKLFSLLNPGGVLFINETPHRWFPVETHTTKGFPLINYLPDSFVHYLVNKYSKRYPPKTWDELLRLGIRGGTAHELLKILRNNGNEPQLLTPTRVGMADRIDVFMESLPDKRLPGPAKTLLRVVLKVFKGVTGLVFTPTIQLAIKKPDRS
jgi:2-polyprenyl-3-methyl-5-hydroxy-6-metoxy-1,4-benzoquinol methylase